MERRVLNLLKSKRNALVHVFWADHDLGYLDLLLRRTINPLCATFHNCDDTLFENLRFPSRVRQLDAVILMSKTQCRFFKECGVPEERIHVILHGVDTSYFRPQPARDSSIFTVLSVGSYRRNFTLLREMCSVFRDHSSIRFRIVAAAHFNRMFDNLPNVTFLTGMSDAGLLREYQQASCFLATAENATANNALLEALACGLPIIAERVGGIPEYLDARCGLVSDHANSEDLIQHILRLFNSPQLQSEMAASSRRRAEELDWTHVAKKTEEIYRQLACPRVRSTSVRDQAQLSL